MRTIRYHVDTWAGKRPDKIFVVAPEPDLTLTFADLQTSCIKYGRYLLRQGLKKGDKISFMMGNGYQTTKIFLAAMYSGFVISPLNLNAQPSQLTYVLDHSDTKLVFVTDLQRDRLLESLGSVKRKIEIVVIDKNRQEILPHDDLSDLVLPEIDEQDPALLLYTSGTTGRPKGAILTHRSMISGGCNVIEAHEMGADDIGLVSLPLYHINAEVVSVMAPLVGGSSIVMPERFSATQFWPLLSQYRCTWFSVVPTIISYLVSGTDIVGKDYHLDQVRFGRSASSALPPSLHHAFEKKFNISIVETMGLTECAAPVFSNPLDQAKRKYGSPGQPVGNEAKIIDKQGRECPRSVVGEIMIRGDNVLREYYKEPEITAQALEPDGWFHTGDLGYMDEDGFVFVTGRLKELIIKGGENISPREIDECFYAHPDVLDAAAVGIPDEHYGEEIMVCCTLKQGTACTVDQLREYCLKNLGKYKTPKIIKLLDYLPKGPSGKIQRLRLPALVNELIVKNSLNIVPEQIDEIVCEHPEVLDAASAGIPDEQCGQEILLCCTLKPGSSCTEQDLRDYCVNRLGEFKTPKILKVVQKLPRDSSGIIERVRLSELLNK